MKNNLKNTKKINKLYLGLALSFGMMGFGTTTAFADGHHGTQTVDFNQPLPALESLANIKQKPFSLPTFHRFSTDNGVRVIFTQLTSLPMVDINIEFLAGSAHDGQIRTDAQGIANMTATMLTKGTKSLNEEQYLLAKDKLGINLGASATKDSFGVSLRSLSNPKTLQSALLLTQQILTEPVFDESVLARQKAQLTDSLKQSEQDPNQVASRAYAKALFGSHPYATPITGDIQGVQAISRDDLQAFKDKFLVAQNAVITITGDLEMSEAKRIANVLANALPSGQKALPLDAPKPPKPTHIHINHDSTQTAIIMGHLAPKSAQSDDEFAKRTEFELGNTALAGGGFNARLMDEIREKRGYTYGIYGRSHALKASGSYQIAFSTANHQTKNAITDTLNVVNQTVTHGIRPDEFSLSANQRKHRYPMGFASNSAIHGIASTLNVLDLPDSHATDEIQRIQNTTLDGVNHALKHGIRPADFVIITVGKDKPDLSDLIGTP